MSDHVLPWVTLQRTKRTPETLIHYCQYCTGSFDNPYTSQSNIFKVGSKLKQLLICRYQFFFLNFGGLSLSYFLYSKQNLAQMVNNLPAMPKTRVWFLGWEDPLQEEMETHSSLLAWRIPCTEEPGGLQSIGSQRVRKDLTTNTSLQTKWNFTEY